MGERPRIKRELIGEIIVDEATYVANKSTERARKVIDSTVHIEIEIWCDQHYYKRAIVGDQNGKREGIQEGVIASLVARSINHLLYFSLKHKGFSFINFEESIRYQRVVLKENGTTGKVNVVTEFHYVSRNKYEVTVITAMQSEEFKIGVGQFTIEIDGESSILSKNEGGKIVEIDTFN